MYYSVPSEGHKFYYIFLITKKYEKCIRYILIYLEKHSLMKNSCLNMCSVKIYKSDGDEPLQELWQILTCVGMRMGLALRTDPGYTNNGCWSPGSCWDPDVAK